VRRRKLIVVPQALFHGGARCVSQVLGRGAQGAARGAAR
jgi:hypothetical protein